MLDPIVQAAKEMTVSPSNPIWLTIVIAVLGLAGTIGSPLVTGPREKRRLASEERRARQTLLFDSKRLAYVAVIRLADERILQMEEPLFAGYDGVDEQQTFNGVDGRWMQRWRDLRAEVALLDPSLPSLMEVVLDRFHDWGDEIGHNYVEHGMTHAVKVTEAMTALQTKMLESLGTST